MGAAIEVRDLSKRFRVYHERNQSLKVALMRGRRAKYDEFWALRDVSFDIPTGKTFGLVGHNGSGKSTLLKCLARILVPDRGSVSVNGKVSALLELGAGFHPELSGRDNIYLNGSILGLSKREIDHRFDDIVGFAGLEEFIDSPVKNYSSGMYVRLGFSVAINVDPEILLVDEVLAVGDEEFQRRCMDKFHEYKNDGRTIVVVSHAMGTMRSLCDEVAWLSHGRLQEVGKPSEVVDDYVEDSQSSAKAHDEEIAYTREVSIDRAEVIGSGGGPVRTGEPCTIRLHYSSTSPVVDPVFKIGIHSVGGVYITGPSTRVDGLEIDQVAPAGRVDIEIPCLDLLPGGYVLSSAVYDSAMEVSFHRPLPVRFDVFAGRSRENLGVVTLGGRWHHVPAAVSPEAR
jgi:ABC-type polysaccharide/polyol phosphate transport system ATPase subunit